MKPIATLIGAHPFFAGVDQRHLHAVAACARNAAFKNGDYLLREGGNADAFFLIRRGAVALGSLWPGRGPQIVETLRSGDFVGASWLVPPFRWAFDARAIGDVGAIAFDAACLQRKCDSDPALGYDLMRRFVPAVISRLRAARLQAMDLCAPR